MIAPLHFTLQIKASNFSFEESVKEVHNNYKLIKGKLILAGSQPGRVIIKTEGSVPDSIPAFIATNALEIHRRPISSVFLNIEFKDGETASLNSEQLNTGINYQMPKPGDASFLAYTSMPRSHYDICKQTANDARSKRPGIWRRMLSMILPYLKYPFPNDRF